MWRGVYPAESGAHVGVLDSGKDMKYEIRDMKYEIQDDVKM